MVQGNRLPVSQRARRVETYEAPLNKIGWQVITNVAEAKFLLFLANYLLSKVQFFIGKLPNAYPPYLHISAHIFMKTVNPFK